MKILFLFLFFLPSIIFSDLAADKAALLRLSSAVRGNTLSWNRSSLSPCSWDGVTCDNTTNRVTALRLPGDGLSGTIPENSIGNLTELRILSLRRNVLSGQLPPDIGSCVNLHNVFLQNNRFSGEIPRTLFSLRNLIRLDISSNNFSGELSPEFNKLTTLRNLYLQNNQFTGSIPELNITLVHFNVSFNRLNGRIPLRFANFPADSFIGNDDQLCGAPLDPCPSEGGSDKLSAGAIAGIVIGSVVGSILIILTIFLLCRNCINRGNSRGVGAVTQVGVSSIPPSPDKPPEIDFRSPDPIVRSEYTDSVDGFSGREENHDELVFFGEVGRFSLEDLLRASAEVLGKGTVGTTYKAYLDDGSEVIVKRLKNVYVSMVEFRDKVESLGELYHENLLPVRGYFYGREEKLLVSDFMPRGSLASILHGNKGADIRAASALTWEIRSILIYHIACGLEYLHSHNLPHGNIKSHNILLTHEYRACVSEFGLNRLVSSPTPNLIGYRAPEVIDTRILSREADVYSFGILVLEVLTGKDPTNALNEEGIDLRNWIQSIVEERWTIDVLDPSLLKYPNIEQQLIKLLHLGVRCAAQVPGRRPSMAEAVWKIKNICKF